ncbi:MAG: carbamoyltransferase HypF, partial [Nitrospirae bacterium]|nr:carbamoyltransferase HypF [Nitrospirota bacterium]
GLDRDKFKILRKMIDKKINSPLTSSAGRLFDAVSALLGVRKEVYYEGQAAIELEMKANPEEAGMYQFSLREYEGKTEIVMGPVIKGIVSDIAGGAGVDIISARFHNTIAHIVLNVCLRIRELRGINCVVLSGGVFQNALFLDRTFALLNASGFRVYTHHRVPPNDGGIALGQAIIANEWIKKGKI